MSKIASWNVRGLNQPTKQKEVRVFMNYIQIGLCALLETRIAYPKIHSVFDKVFCRWHWISNAEYGSRGCRIVIGWDPEEYYVNLQDMSDQSVHCWVQAKSGSKAFFYSVIYAANNYIDRRSLWRDLRKFKAAINASP
ncbi:hypothetical protein Pint_31804 [Pistacia integerrima]|uniref:Uncharacterized protein n=1 Tax=Pistacia integerrima TaxID=434235 RepID=A0ACC0XPH9_9ROSI|nr:hypothetical protein Pint_31804 [Pistacia integerrima]